MSNRDNLLKGQTAIITGAATGIGRSISMAMADAGADVVVNFATKAEEARQLVQDITRSGRKAASIRADVSDEKQVREMFRVVVESFGTVDILVNNAGIQKDSSFVDMSLSAWNRVIEVNLTGAFLCAREAAREFMRRGLRPEQSKSAGKIIFISSVHEVIPWSGHVNYAASKGGVMLLMKSIAQELAPYRIRVNSIAPGAIKTDINKQAWETPEAEAGLLKLIPYKRVGTPEDIAKVAVWLASDEAEYITGTTIYADGGMLLYPGFSEGG